MTGELFKLRPVEEGIVSFQIASDEAPYLEEPLAPALRDAIHRLESDPTIRVVILKGSGSYFSAGASRSFLLQADDQTMRTSSHNEFPRLLLEIPVPTIAAMEGHAIGGGLVLGLWSDIPILAEESLYGANFMALGFTPGMGATRLLEEFFGSPLARELLYTGRLVKGSEIRNWNVPLSYSVVPRKEVLGRAKVVAREIAEAPRSALSLLKKAFSERRKDLFEAASREELSMHTTLFSREETHSEIARRYQGKGEGI